MTQRKKTAPVQVTTPTPAAPPSEGDSVSPVAAAALAAKPRRLSDRGPSAPSAPTPTTLRRMLLDDPDAKAVVADFFGGWAAGAVQDVAANNFADARGALAGMMLVAEGLQALADAEGQPPSV